MNSTVWVTIQRKNQGFLGTLNSGVAWGRGVQGTTERGGVSWRCSLWSSPLRPAHSPFRGHGVHLAERDHSRRARVGARPWSWSSAGGSPDALAKAGVALMVLKEKIRVGGKHDIPTKVMATTLVALSAEVERDLISERTREGLARSRASGRKLGPARSARLASRASMARRTRAGASSNATSAPARWRGFDERVDINCSGVMAPRRRVSPSSRPPRAFGRADPATRPGAMAGACHGTASATTRGSAGPAAGRAAPRPGNGQRPSSSKLRR